MPPRRTALALAAFAACRPPVPDLPASPPPDARTRIAERCDRGEAPMCLELAASHRDAGDPDRWLAYTVRACELASPRACADLATALERGDGLTKDPARALDLRVQACLGGFAPACLVAADALPPHEAAAFRQRACVGGDTSACPPAPEPPPLQVDPRDQAAVTLALAALREPMRGCYTAALADRPHLRGRLELEIAVDPAGQPRAVAVLAGIDRAVDTCIATLVGRATFAPTTTGAIVVVRWHTTLQPAE